MHPFDLDIALQRQQFLHFMVNISDHWSINGHPNGGYLMAILANAALAVSEKQSISIFTANFIAGCQPGPARLFVEPLGQSKTFDRFQIRLVQNDIEKIRAFATLMSKDTEGEHQYEQSPPELLPSQQCIPIPEIPGHSIFEQMEVRLEPVYAGWMTGNMSERSEQKGWVRFKTKRHLDQLALLLMADAFPPPVMAKHGLVAWVPTIELSVNLRNQPQSDWLKGVFRSRFIDHNIVDEDGEIWDETGNLVAISRQISQFRKL